MIRAVVVGDEVGIGLGNASRICRKRILGEEYGYVA